MPRGFLRSALMVAAALFAAAALAAQPAAAPVSFQQVQAQGASANPADITFSLRCVDAARQYRVGQIIELELAFSSSATGKYTIDGGLYDRSGRMSEDVYHLDPQEGACDPLEAYFEFGPGGMGGLRQMPTLEPKPHLIRRDLNEWIRIDKPGHYRLFVVSRRLEVEDPKTPHRITRTALTSNIVEFDVLPADEAWARQRLRDAVAVLDSGSRKADTGGAARVLRFLGTVDAAREMIRQLGSEEGPGQWEFSAGLIGSPHRQFIVQEMERAIDLPDRAISDTFLRTLSLLAFKLQHPEPPPAYSGVQDKDQQAAWREQDRRWNEAKQAVSRHYCDRLAAAVPGKSRKAKAITVSTLIDQYWVYDHIGVADKPDWLSRMPGEIASVFADLPIGVQCELLNYRWRRIAGVHMLLALRQICEQPLAAKQGQDTLRSAALRRLYELSPEEGRKLILQEIAIAPSRLSPATMDLLLRLDDATLPQLDQTLAANLEREGDAYAAEVAARLVQRYATAAIAPRVKACYEANIGRQVSGIDTALLAYMLRVDEPSGEAMVRAALAAPASGRERLLSGIASQHWCATLEKIGIEQLNDPDLLLAADAASALGRWGSASAQAALWRRLELLHRQGAPATRPASRMAPPGADWHFEVALMHALVQGTNWLADPTTITKVKALCNFDDVRVQCDNIGGFYGAAGKVPIFAGYDDSGPFSGRVAQYDADSLDKLKAKLAQFPPGTTFVPGYSGNSAESEQRRAFDDIEAFVQGRGMKLQR